MQTCHSAIKTVSGNAQKRIILMGQPNTGKSTFFNTLTGMNAYVGNWPGITVDLLQGEIDIQGQTVEIVDLPGIYDLEGFSEDESIVQRFLTDFAMDLVLIIVNASQIDRQLNLVLQLKALGLPCMVILNMADEAKRYGIDIDQEKLAQKLGLPIFLVSAKYNKGITEVLNKIKSNISAQKDSFKLENINDFLKDNPIDNQEKKEIFLEAVKVRSHLITTFTEKLDNVLLHPIFGIPIFFASMLGVFFLIWYVGLPSQDVIDIATTWMSEQIIEPVINPFPDIVQSFLLNGVWLGVATVASFVPLIVVFFFVMAAVEDSGYLSRSAYLMDAFMAKMGLDGRAFVMQMMGFGCNVPALMGTRIIRSRPMRMLSMLIIPFALCSARLAVFVFIIGAIFPMNLGPLVLFFLYILSFVASFLVAFVFSKTEQFKSKEPFVIELPPYRLPTFKQVLLRGWGEVKEFLRRATNFIIIGCVAVWFLTYFPENATGLDTWGGQLGVFLSPIMEPIGINPFLTLSLIFGFIAKEIVVGSFATIYGMGTSALTAQFASTIAPSSAISFCVFCLLYTPCLTTVATVKAESKSWAFTIFSLVFSLVYAWGMAFIFYRGALFLGFE
ncbi:ferrous iron transport protein B [Cyanobacterium stanieri PCC 7202]|uniref:Ferrous iron transport protein B n=1 Tax=Cyanobacterium stanieri (strain ATCC 29140 / PCC 7202) TaxID=292563 RepID=K9YJS6_CYASC|nr:ferrous iron transport protein B [Cyanobacterium stanieri PCC 7202]